MEHHNKWGTNLLQAQVLVPVPNLNSTLISSRVRHFAQTRNVSRFPYLNTEADESHITLLSLSFFFFNWDTGLKCVANWTFKSEFGLWSSDSESLDFEVTVLFSWGGKRRRRYDTLDAWKVGVMQGFTWEVRNVGSQLDLFILYSAYTKFSLNLLKFKCLEFNVQQNGSNTQRYMLFSKINIY